MRSKGNLFLGVILIVSGSIIFLSRTHIIDFSWNLVWPMLVLGVGVMFHLMYLFGNHKDAGVLVPGGIFTTYGILFYICVLFGWNLMTYIWPLFILGPGIGLFELFIFGEHERALVFPVFLILGLGCTFLFITLFHIQQGAILPLILIFIGISIMLSSIFKPLK